MRYPVALGLICSKKWFPDRDLSWVYGESVYPNQLDYRGWALASRTRLPLTKQVNNTMLKRHGRRHLLIRTDAGEADRFRIYCANHPRYSVGKVSDTREVTVAA